MTKQSGPVGAAAAPRVRPSGGPRTSFAHDRTLVLALELSGKGWEVGAVLPGVARRPRRRLAPRDMAGLLRQIEAWKAEARRGPDGAPDGAELRRRPGRVLDVPPDTSLQADRPEPSRPPRTVRATPIRGTAC